MELFLLYIWLKLDGILLITTLFGIGFGMFCFVACMLSGDTYEGKDYIKRWTERRNLSAKIALALVLSAIILPSKTDVAILVGANYALKATETPEAQKVMSILRAKANEILDAELKGEKK